MGEGEGTGLTTRQWLTVCALSVVNIASSVCVSIQAPFYPKEAERKGATATEYGLVFGVYEFVSFVSSPIFGKYIDVIGAKVLINGGIMLSGFSAFLFGWLDLIDSHTWFIALSFLIRISESLGTSASCTAIFSITATVFPNSVATTIAVVEIFYGLGFIAGPTVGGYLYELGGFSCPFWVVGGLLMSVGVFVFFVLPGIDKVAVGKKTPAQIMSVLTLWPVLLDLFAVVSATISVGYFSATLEPHLRQFHLSPVGTGSMFIISGGTYAVTSPLVGRLCDTGVSPKKMIVFGSMLIILSFMLVGPIPFLPLHTVLWVVCVGLVLHGLGYSCILIATFIDAIRSSVARGLPNNIKTYGIISGLWASSFCLGGFIGPSVAGVLYDAYGFRLGTLFVIAVHCILITCLSCYICVEGGRPASQLDHMTAADDEPVDKKHVHFAGNQVIPSDTEPLMLQSQFEESSGTESQPLYGSLFPRKPDSEYEDPRNPFNPGLHETIAEEKNEEEQID